MHSPTVRRRRLAAELRKLRLSAELGSAQAAKKLGWPASKLTRIERAERGVAAPDLAALLELYEVNDPQTRDGLMALQKQSKERGWWYDYRDVFGGSALPDFEAEASHIQTFEGLAVPGLLETPDYIKAAFRAGDALPDSVVERHLEARLERQRILEGHNPAKLTAIIDEAALRRMVGGPRVMYEQIQHLAHMAIRHNVDLRVLPFSAGAHAGMLGAFTLLHFPNPLDTSLGFIESVAGTLIVEEPHQLERLSEVFGHLQGSALLPNQTVDLLHRMLDDIPI